MLTVAFTGSVYLQMFEIDVCDRLLVYEAEYNVLEDEGASAESAADAAGEDMAKKYSRLQQSHQTVTKYNLDLVEQLEVSTTWCAQFFKLNNHLPGPRTVEVVW